MYDLMAEFDSILVENTHRFAVDENTSATFIGNVELARVFEFDHTLFAGDFPGGAFQFQVHVHGLILRGPTQGDLSREIDD